VDGDGLMEKPWTAAKLSRYAPVHRFSTSPRKTGKRTPVSHTVHKAGGAPPEGRTLRPFSHNGDDLNLYTERR
jgi:hypothetical protein